MPPPSVLQAPLKEERLSDAAYYAKLTAQAGEVPIKNFLAGEYLMLRVLILLLLLGLLVELVCERIRY